MGGRERERVDCTESVRGGAQIDQWAHPELANMAGCWSHGSEGRFLGVSGEV